VTLRFARALLNHPSEVHAEEAARLARRVIYEAPAGAGGDEGREIEGQALGTLPSAKRKPFESPAAEERMARARGLVAARQSREALREADALMALPEAAKPSDFACEAAGLRAEALEQLKRKAEASDAHGEAVARCEGASGRPEALYRAGRAAMRASAPAEAARRFAQLEQESPKHRLADDARYHGARSMLSLGDEAQFVRLLSAMPDDYPEGDMVADGLFEVALFEIERGSWSGAVVPLERALERFPRERAYHAAGRLPYYLGRARIETGSREQGVALLSRAVREYPLTYYMALAHARLGELDPAEAARALAEAAGREEAAPFEIPRSPAFAQPAFLRAVELARQGEARLARGELDQLGVGARTAPAELLWASAFLLARAGAPAQSHGILRTAMNAPRPDRVEITEWLDHYPAGRWRSAWELAYPRPFAGIVAMEAKRQGIPEALAYAIMREESAFEPRVSSPANAHGLMQLIVPTAKRMAKPLGLPWDAEALKRPEVNVALGCRYLSILRKEFPDNPLLAIPGYNAGGGAPKKWIAERPAQSFDVWVERIPYEETRLYTKRVITSLAAYEFLYTRDLPSEALRTPLPASPSALSAVASAAP
jgi:soluble lytic murein transglycosylase